MASLFKETASQGGLQNNDIYMISSEEGSQYEEPKERNTRVFYKLKVSEDPTSKNMCHKEDFDDGNYESIEEKETAVWSHPS